MAYTNSDAGISWLLEAVTVARIGYSTVIINSCSIANSLVTIFVACLAKSVTMGVVGQTKAIIIIITASNFEKEMVVEPIAELTEAIVVVVVVAVAAAMD